MSRVERVQLSIETLAELDSGIVAEQVIRQASGPRRSRFRFGGCCFAMNFLLNYAAVIVCFVIAALLAALNEEV